jgi:CRP-like cAMP-binding protein
MRAPGKSVDCGSWEQTMSTTEKVSAAELADLPLFAGLDQADLESLSGQAVRRILADGETLVDMGAPISEVHWLTKGQVALRVRHEHRWVLVSTLHAGDMLGWSALREDPTALSTARAIGPAVLVSVQADGLLALLTGGSARSRMLLRRLFGTATHHLDESRAQLLQLGHEGVISAG